MTKEISLRYGANPYQTPSRVFMKDGELPIQVLSSAPGYINLLDALNSWQLVRELRQALNMPAAASFKHVSPSGAAVGVPLSETLKKTYFVDDIELSPLASAYARARGVDRMSSFGDWVALSDRVDVATARLIAREVSDGIIAPAYDPEALAILTEKKKGKYVVVEIDPAYEPDPLEKREVFGVTFEQRRNDRLVNHDDFKSIVTTGKNLPDMTPFLIALLITTSSRSRPSRKRFKASSSNSATRSKSSCLYFLAASNKVRPPAHKASGPEGISSTVKA